jgi:predicted NBD/HSP70 family sugar kinase
MRQSAPEIHALGTAGAGHVLSLILSGQAKSRADLARISDLSRATITQRLGVLFEAGLLHEASETQASGGRPARVLKLNEGFGIVLVADVGETRIRVAATDLGPTVLAERLGDLDVGRGPVPILTWIAEQFRALLAEIGRPARDVLGIGLSLPAPVDYGAGRVVGPSVMAGWDDFDIPGWFAGEYDVPVFAENDVRLRTLAEHRQFWPDEGQLVFIKAGTGIGSGIVTDGRMHRGARGAAGDVGHIQLRDAEAPLCRCGKLGCVEAYAAGWAIARDLRARGFEARDARDVLALVERNRPEAISLVRQAGRVLGEVAADVVSVLNPSVIVIGGTLSRAGEHLLAGVREIVYQRCLPLATRDLRIVAARSGETAGLLGAARLVIDAQLQPHAVDRLIARPGPAQAS